jgi:hypothetical protein
MMTGLRWLRVPTVAAIMALAGLGLSEGVGELCQRLPWAWQRQRFRPDRSLRLRAGRYRPFPAGPIPGSALRSGAMCSLGFTTSTHHSTTETSG